MSDYKRGSEWRRWDLHVHTASSYDYKYKGQDSDELLCAKLKENNVSVVAITDHFIIDKDRIEKLRNLAPDIVFFPGVELRTDKGNTNIHVILIFSNESDFTNLCEDFNSFKRNTAKHMNDCQKIYWDYNDILAFAKRHDAIISIHAGGKSNGLDDCITNSIPHNLAVKEEFADSIHIFDMGKKKDFDEYEEKVFKIIERKPMIICSDNHDPREYVLKEKLWIKGDPKFSGLKYVVNEPSRVFVGEIPPALDRVYKNKTKTLSSLNISWAESYKGLLGEWFNNVSLEFNPEMIAVIGNKGSGKTAIAEITALLSNSKNENNFMFLNKNKFRKKNLASNFVANLMWSSNGIPVSKNLNDSVDNNQDELVHFIPQSSFETFCNESDEDFISEINDVVFSRMEEHVKAKFSTFKELSENQKQVLTTKKKEVSLKVDELNKKIEELEIKKDTNHKASLENSLNQLKLELAEHVKIKPPEVKPPEDVNTSEFEKLNNELENISNNIADNKVIKFTTHQKLAALNLVFDEIKEFEITIKEKAESIKTKLREFEIVKEDIFTYKFDLLPVNLCIENLKNKITELDSKICEEPSKEGELIIKANEIKKQINSFNEENTGKLTFYQKYKEQLEEWTNKEKKLSEKIESLSLDIEYIGDFKTSKLVEDINSLKNDRFILVGKIFECYLSEVKIYEEFKSPLSAFIAQYSKQLENYDISIDAGIYPLDDFTNSFVETFIDSTCNSSFKGTKGQKEYKDLVSESDFSCFDGIKKFITKVQYLLEKDSSGKCYHGIFKKSKYKLFVEQIYNLKFLEPRYSLRLYGKPLNELSPGERGSLLLVFYLLLDARDIPLILDQPEDNLDNQSVAEILVPFIKEAKKRRQVMIITHNANLAVVSDAEQIIRVKLDKQGNNKFTFESGSLESTIINDVVDVLEGTKNSFKIRKNKYHI